MMICPGLAVAIGAGLPLAGFSAAPVLALAAGLVAELASAEALALVAGAADGLAGALDAGAAPDPQAASSSEQTPAVSQPSFLWLAIVMPLFNPPTSCVNPRQSQTA